MKTYFYRMETDDNWYRLTINREVDWNLFLDCEEAVELRPNGAGKYKRCKAMPMKEDCFYKLPETMTMIALQAISYKL